MIADAGGSLWNIRPWEAAMPLLAACGWAGASALLSPRARANRAKLRRQRRSERRLVQRQRAW